MHNVVSLAKDGQVAIVSVDSPPVNALGHQVREQLAEAFGRVCGDPEIGAIVLICEGRTFFAGADVSEFGKPRLPPTLGALFEAIEKCAKLTLAAIHGNALGGGLELALACDLRIAIPSARLGFPEIKLGLLPGAGGTQRLPRLVGVESALDLITSGRSIPASEALALGLIDRMAEEKGLEKDAISFARKILADGTTIVPARDREDRIGSARGRQEIFTAFREGNARLFRGSRAADHIVRAVEAAVTLPFDAGLARERALFSALEASAESRAQRYAFFSERGTAKIPDVDTNAAVDPVRTVGVIGAGTMGGGIAMNFLDAGIPVTLVERDQSALDRGVGLIRRSYEAGVAKGRLTAEQAAQRMGMVTPAFALAALRDADLVIEAVFEEMALKIAIFHELDAVARPGAILASNTSYLDLDAIASATGRPEHVVGLHFFSPANVMRLLEVVRGERTSRPVVAAAFQLARKIGKIPVLSRVCPGFVANRIMSKRRLQAEALVLEGPTPWQIDEILTDYGFAIGHFQMADLVGLDVLGRENSERTLRGDLVALGRLGQKSGAGFYDYDENRRPNPSPIAQGVIADYAAFRGIKRNAMPSERDILLRLLLPVVNEGAKLIEEGIALRASDIDVAALLGYNWPSHRGGPMFWADELGLATVVAELRKLEAAYGDDFRPAALLEELAAQDRNFTR